MNPGRAISSFINSVSGSNLDYYQGSGSYGMAYDGAGNLTSASTSFPAHSAYHGTASYSYDTRDELSQENSPGSGGSAVNYEWDAAGNPVTFRGSSEPTFNIDDQNPLFTFDDNGNPTNYSGSDFGYDPENHLNAIGSTWTAGYMADGLRAWKDSAGTATWYLYDGDQPVVETDGSGNVTAVDMFGADGLVERELASGQTAYLFDPQGNASERLTSAGTLKSSSIYDAFGAQTTTASTPDTYGFGAQYGYYTDTETGLELLTNRYYDPNTGRFVNEDPSGFDGGSDPYRYAGNNPINEADPTGLSQDMDPGGGPQTARLSLAFYIPTYWAAGFSGDNRGPDRNSTSYRGEINVEVNHATGKVSVANLAGVSKLFGMFAVHDSATGMHAAGAPCGSGGFNIHVYGHIANALTYKASHLAINYDFTIHIDDKNNVTMSGRTTDYPAMELWEYDSSGTTMLYNYAASGYGVFKGLTKTRTVSVK